MLLAILHCNTAWSRNGAGMSFLLEETRAQDGTPLSSIHCTEREMQRRVAISKNFCLLVLNRATRPPE